MILGTLFYEPVAAVPNAVLIGAYFKLVEKLVCV